MASRTLSPEETYTPITENGTVTTPVAASTTTPFMIFLWVAALAAIALSVTAFSLVMYYDVAGKGHHDDDDDDNAYGVPVVGSTGETGETGPQGPNGIQGVQGVPGLPGVDGIDGINGINGINGTDGTAGAVGPSGPQGLQGFSCWDSNENAICDPSEDLTGDDDCDVYDCEIITTWHGVYNGTCPCECSLTSWECHGQTLVCPMTGEVFTCSAMEGKYLANQLEKIGENYGSCPNGYNLKTAKACGATYGLSSIINTGFDMGMPFVHNSTITQVGISMGLTINGPYDIQVYGSGDPEVDDVSTMALICTLAANVTSQAHMASVEGCNLNGQQFIAMGIENNSGFSISQFTLLMAYRHLFKYCSEGL